MRTIVVGLGIQGNKRVKFAGEDLVAVVDPIKENVQYKTIDQVPLNSYDSALVCTPDQAKFEILEYLLKNKKNLLVEKPILAKDSTQIKKLQNLANENNVVCYTAYNHRFEPFFVRASQDIQSGKLGKIHLLRMFYGNGTARDVRNSVWRDKDMGVLSDLGSHLLDTILFFFGFDGSSAQAKFEPWTFNTFENKAPDHVTFGGELKTSSSKVLIELEATMLSWRNTFSLDIIGEDASVHMNCLCKWGPSSYSFRKRKLPSGRPDEEIDTLTCADPTWEIEYQYFKDLCLAKTNNKQNNLANDIWINQTLNQLWRDSTKF